ncbi:hypothetical protein PHYBLDRAFT_170441 [Phycomyces blakesleeanus NRRL 1555(-)]|uniref:Uncharacterized protein n=1 Tax=Phycomyces blakesleeanus (strain ATCC 8743b / DSM 1359 / FGSC 10004 / NBRC 33097 / NRRL 1555) TaxID=763407 RepID=A0A162PPT6_PHYB8|nr:hypothetical protein PHYBLDRAFT_170441 [Phycomyces blakesleeanus NRRL 1555(-)]OAD71786.1 hypothetical protein PHYBLDRAFT_170441 [Phycomyces blakesleeanus NRRL 1555(-)]|eukprot:XP_018289826.1 hypothetical protein PHYBLDRAFT_170441 [Phycomyces blakesleeanus NRRL 1555(-)]
MSDINTTLLNSIQKIEVDLAEIKQALRELQRQFSNQFVPAVSAEDLTTMQQSIIEQSSLEHIAKSVKKAQLTEYPDQLGHTVKHDIIDKDFPAASKEWKNIPEKNREYYMMHLESFKSDNLTHKRRMAEKNKTQQDISYSSLSSPDMSETGDVESPIMADVLVNAYFTEQVSTLYKEIDHSVKAAKEKQEVVLELKAIEQKKECNRGKEGRLIFF